MITCREIEQKTKALIFAYQSEDSVKRSQHQKRAAAYLRGSNPVITEFCRRFDIDAVHCVLHLESLKKEGNDDKITDWYEYLDERIAIDEFS